MDLEGVCDFPPGSACSSGSLETIALFSMGMGLRPEVVQSLCDLVCVITITEQEIRRAHKHLETVIQRVAKTIKKNCCYLIWGENRGR